MPELPEVETIVRALRPELTGRKIVSARLLWARTLATPSAEQFVEKIVGQEILAVTRRAKYLHLQLSTLRQGLPYGYDVDKLNPAVQGKLFNLFFHLRMSGDLSIKAGDALPDKHDRLHLGLSDGRLLVFNDTRKFGRAWLVADPEKVIGGLGPEPFDPSFTSQMLYDNLHKRHRQMKALLLDQRFIAGLGNIYTDEALHLSGVHPLRLSDTISLPEAEKLLSAIQTVLQSGIEHNGASIDWVYRGGSFQNYFRVYNRAGQACPVCGMLIQRIVVGQRGTHFCPTCQVM